MTDIVERLHFDATRCELTFSKGVAGNISEAAAEIERLRAALLVRVTGYLESLLDRPTFTPRSVSAGESVAEEGFGLPRRQAGFGTRFSFETWAARM